MDPQNNLNSEIKLKKLIYDIEDTSNSLKQLASQEKELLAKLLNLSQLQEMKNAYNHVQL